MELIERVSSLIRGKVRNEEAELSCAKISRLPDNLDKHLFIDALLGRQFMVYHDLESAETLMVSDSERLFKTLCMTFPGLELEQAERPLSRGRRLLLINVLVTKENENVFDNIYRVFSGTHSFLAVCYVLAGKKYVVKVKNRIEDQMSSKEVGFAKSSGSKSGAYSNGSTTQHELYYDSDEKRMLLGALEMLNGAMLVNGVAYKTVLAIDEKDLLLHEYIKANMLITHEKHLQISGLADLWNGARIMKAIPFDSAHAASTLGFSNLIVRSGAIASRGVKSDGDLMFGRYLEESLRETEIEIRAKKETLNLGTLIGGVPGTGKTFAAMHLMNDAIVSGKVPTVIISPTEEWDSFGAQNSFHVIRLYESRVPFNFFRCDSGVNTERFYENLAMLLAAASDAGPYTGSLEKCLLSAFRKLYARTSAPDPQEAYEEIEEAIIEQHAKRSNAGIRYTKHGENVRAALENIRQMLNKPEFSYREGVNFEKLLHHGVVFDLSKMSNKLKPFFYSLILNQAYCFADSLQANGDRELRLLLCLEEAQLIFGREERSAAAEDLMQRIQDFRKKGVGLILIAHNVTDIEPGIRRLCQNKLYFRQSADVARYSAADLLFNEEERDALVERLKSLEQRVCALSYITERKGEKSLANSLFVRVPPVTLETTDAKVLSLDGAAMEKKRMSITLSDKEGIPKPNVKFRVYYLGEKICEGISDPDGSIVVENTIADKRYQLVLLGESKKDTKKFSVFGGETNHLSF